MTKTGSDLFAGFRARVRVWAGDGRSRWLMLAYGLFLAILVFLFWPNERPALYFRLDVKPGNFNGYLQFQFFALLFMVLLGLAGPGKEKAEVPEERVGLKSFSLPDFGATALFYAYYTLCLLALGLVPALLAAFPAKIPASSVFLLFAFEYLLLSPWVIFQAFLRVFLTFRLMYIRLILFSVLLLSGLGLFALPVFRNKRTNVSSWVPEFLATFASPRIRGFLADFLFYQALTAAAFGIFLIVFFFLRKKKGV